MPSLRVLSQSFECPLPYAEGHVCTASEASELNRLRTQRVAALARKKISEGEPTQQELEELAQGYEFRTGPFVMPSDPVVQEAHKIAKNIVNQHLLKQNIKIDGQGFLARVSEVSQRPDVRAEATRRIERLREVASQALDIDDLIGGGG